MNKHQKESYLKESGFTYDRTVRHGKRWTDGVSTIVMSRSDGHDKAFRKDVDMAVERREQALTAKIGEFQNVRVVPSPNNSPYSENKRMLVTPVVAPEPVAVEPETVDRSKRQRLDPEERYLVCLRIEELIQEGLGCTRITRTLGLEGFKMPNGDPILEGWVSNTMKDIRDGNMMEDPTKPKVQEAPRPVVQPTPTLVNPTRVAIAAARASSPVVVPPVAPVVVVPSPKVTSSFMSAILSESTLTPGQRLEMLRTYVKMVPQSPMVNAILSEAMGTEQTFKMLEVYLGSR